MALLCALILSGASAFTTVSGMYELYHLAGAFMVLLICSGIEVVRISSIYYISLYWQALGKFFRTIGLALIICACGISAIGTSSFFMSAYNKQTNKVAPHQIQVVAKEEQIKAIQRENASLQEEIGRHETQASEWRQRLGTLSAGEDGLQTPEQVKLQNDINWRTNQANNRGATVRTNEAQIRTLQTEISQLRIATIEDAPELSRLVPIGKLFGINDPSTMISILTILLIFAFDPAAVWLMLFSTRLRKMVNRQEAEVIEGNEELKTDIIADMGLSTKLKGKVGGWFKKKKEDKPIEEPKPIIVDPVLVEETTPVVEPEVKVEEESIFKIERVPVMANSRPLGSKWSVFTPKKRITTKITVPKESVIETKEEPKVIENTFKANLIGPKPTAVVKEDDAEIRLSPDQQKKLDELKMQRDEKKTREYIQSILRRKAVEGAENAFGAAKEDVKIKKKKNSFSADTDFMDKK